jgi:hypothetical protein
VAMVQHIRHTMARALLPALLAAVALFVPAQALGVGTPLTSAIWTESPDIWGNRVIYSQKNLNEQWRTYVYNLSTKQAVALSGAQIESHIPSLHGNMASWTEANWALGQINVVAMDVVSHKQWVPSAPFAEYVSAIIVSACDNNDRWVIFRLQVNTGWLGFDLKEADYLYDTQTAHFTPLTPDAYASSEYDRPSLSDRWAVWSANNGSGPANIYYYDLQNPPGIHQLTDVTATGGAIGPVADGNLAVWSEWDGAHWQVWVADLTTAAKSQVTTGAHDHLNPYIDHTTIAYTDYAKGPDDSEIYLFDTITGQTKSLTNDRGRQDNVSLYGTRFVWADWRGDETGSRVYMTTVAAAGVTLAVRRVAAGAVLSGRARSIAGLPIKNASLTLQRSSTGRSWKTLTTVKTSSTGAFSYRTKVRAYVRALCQTSAGTLVSKKASTK